MKTGKPIDYNRDYPNTGVMFKRKAEGKQPNHAGSLYIAGEVLEHILKRHEDGKDVVLELAGWDRTSKAGNGFMSISVKAPYKQDDDIPF